MRKIIFLFCISVGFFLTHNALATFQTIRPESEKTIEVFVDPIEWHDT